MSLHGGWKSVVASLTLAWAATACGGAKAVQPNTTPQVTSIVVTPGADTLVALGDTQQLTATAKDASGSTIGGVTFKWSSANPAVASVDSVSGVVTAVGDGTAAIAASASGVTGQAAVAVSQQVSAVAVTPGTAGLSAIGDTVRFTAAATDANGGSVSGINFLWVSSDPTVATVDTTGLATAKAPGQTTITAAARGVPGNADLSVTQAATQLAFSVQPSTVAAGSALDPAVQVEVRDAGGKLVAGSRTAVTISMATNPGSATLSGTKTVNAVGGIATFSGLWLDKAATGDALQATATSLTKATSASFDVTPGAPAELVFTQEPPTTVPVNTVMNPAVAVEIHDAYGNVVPTGQVSVTISSTPWPGATLGGTLSVAASGGLATFNDLQTDRPGNGYTLVASLGGVSAASTRFHATLALTTVSAGEGHACGLTASGVAYCWGANSFGQLGNGTTAPDSVPSPAAPGMTFSAISAGGFDTCGLSGTDIYCWGRDTHGQLGNGSVANSVPTPVKVAGAHTFAAVSAGLTHTCALTTTNTTFCWGLGADGELGDDTTASSDTAVALFGSYTFVAIAAGDSHTCALTATISGYVYCWGANNHGQLGDGSTNPDSVPVLAMSNAQSVSVGSNHSCALDYTTYIAYCWGDNNDGQIGDGSTRTDHNTPSSVSGTWTNLVTGDTHTCAFFTSDQADCWGSDGNGELGDGTAHAFQLSPTAVFGGLYFTELDGGLSFTCGVASTGSAYCWGRDDAGQLGIGSTVQEAVPTQIIQ